MGVQRCSKCGFEANSGLFGTGSLSYGFDQNGQGWLVCSKCWRGCNLISEQEYNSRKAEAERQAKWESAQSDLRNRTRVEVVETAKVETQIEIPAQSVPGWEGINLAQQRLKHIDKFLGEIIPQLKSIRWTSVIESDDEFSGFTSASITGEPAKRIARVLITEAGANNIIKNVEYDKPSESCFNYQIPDLNDAQFFIFWDNCNDEVKATIVVRPIRIRSEVTIVI